MNVNYLVEPHIVERAGGEVTMGEWVPARKLLTYLRLDIGLKIAYLEMKDKNRNYADFIYESDINMQTNGTYEEIGSPHKNSFEKYRSCFYETFKNMSQFGFNEEKSLIPLSISGDILNGSHRIACAINLGLEVKTAKTNVAPVKRNYNELINRKLESSLVELATLYFVKNAENVRVAFFWPKLNYDQNFELNKLEKVVYKKKISLSDQGKKNLIRILYSHIFFSSVESREMWIERKVNECFSYGDEVHIAFFQCENDEKIKFFKKSLRDYYDCGYSIIHTTDTSEESSLIAGILLNQNGLHFLNNSQANILMILEKVRNIKNLIEREGLNLIDFSIDSGFILEMYGLRKSGDIDFIHYNKDFSGSYAKIDFHQNCLKYHQVESENLVFNPYYYFEIGGVKFISLEQVYYMKAVRNEEKDKADCLLIRQLNRSSNSKYEYTPKINSGIMLNKQLSNIYKIIDGFLDDRYIVYGAGTGARIVCSHMGPKITKIIDSNPSLYGKKMYGIPIFSLDELNKSNSKIIVTVLGREKDIIKELVRNYNVEESSFLFLFDSI